MVKLLQDFKKFLMQGDIITLAVAVVIGTAFVAVVKALVGTDDLTDVHTHTWYLHVDPRGALTEWGFLLQDEPLRKVRDLTCKPAKEGAYTFVVLAWDSKDPPSATKPQNYCCHTISIHVLQAKGEDAGK